MFFLFIILGKEHSIHIFPKPAEAAAVIQITMYFINSTNDDKRQLFYFLKKATVDT